MDYKKIKRKNSKRNEHKENGDKTTDKVNYG